MIGSGLKLHHRGEPVLRLEGLSHCPVTGANACADQSPIKVFAGIEQIIQIHCLMRPVEVANADVKNAGSELRAMVARPGYGGLQVREMAQVQGLTHDAGFVGLGRGVISRMPSFIHQHCL
jgi:hypothetical protein